MWYVSSLGCSISGILYFGSYFAAAGTAASDTAAAAATRCRCIGARSYCGKAMHEDTSSALLRSFETATGKLYTVLRDTV